MKLFQTQRLYEGGKTVTFNINDLIKQIREISESPEKKPSFDEFVAFTNLSLSTAISDSSIGDNQIFFRCWHPKHKELNRCPSPPVNCVICEYGKPWGPPVALAEVIIRICAFFAAYDIDVEQLPDKVEIPLHIKKNTDKLHGLVAAGNWLLSYAHEKQDYAALKCLIQIINNYYDRDDYLGSRRILHDRRHSFDIWGVIQRIIKYGYAPI